MGTIYARGSKLWFAFVDEHGKRQWVSSGLSVGQEAKARRALDALERQISTRKNAAPESGPLTVELFARRWIEERKRKGIASAKDDWTRLERHALPHIGSLLLVDVRPSHVRGMVAALCAKMGPKKTQLAARTVRNIYGVVHRMFADAHADELLDSSPCVLKAGELPKKVDKNREWRMQAVFSVGELEQLVSDPRLTLRQRTLYALLFLGGMRIGEVAALRWRHYEPGHEPLGRLVVANSWDSRLRREKSVKTDVPRLAPVHAVLAAMLARWKLAGWQQAFGRPPTPDDRIMPTHSKKPDARPTTQVVWNRLQKDLDALGLRRRRVHDTRRTLISLSRAAGTPRDLVRLVTHGAEKEQVDQYTTLPWPALCDVVSRVKVELREGQLLTLPIRAAGAAEGVTVAVTVDAGFRGENDVGRGGTRTLTPCGTGF